MNNNTTSHFSNAYCVPGTLLDTWHTLSHLIQQPCGQVLSSLSPFYRWISWGQEKLCISPKVTQLVCGRTEIWTQELMSSESVLLFIPLLVVALGFFPSFFNFCHFFLSSYSHFFTYSAIIYEMFALYLCEVSALIKLTLSLISIASLSLNSQYFLWWPKLCPLMWRWHHGCEGRSGFVGQQTCSVTLSPTLRRVPCLV